MNLTPEFHKALIDLLGADGVMIDKDALVPFESEMRGLMRGRALAACKPRSTEDIAAIMRIAHRTRLPVVVQGGNTGLVGGGLPFDALVISMARMNRIRKVDVVNAAITVEAGAILQQVQEAALEAGMLFPLSLASEGSCTIGGNIASNAGGTAVLRYGNTRDLVLGIEAVLPDGRIFNGLSALRKDNAGYDVKQLFIGSEGTLGIVTAAVLKLYPKPLKRATAFVAAESPDQVVALFARLRRTCGEALTTFEILPRFGMEIVLKHASGCRDPLSAPAQWYALIELTAPDAEAALDEALSTQLEAAFEAEEVVDATLATSGAQADDFWRIREQLSECQRFEGGSIKHDVSVPISDIAAFMRETIAACEAAMPGLRPCVFGHIGDGNLHFNLSQPIGMDKAAFLNEWHAFNAIVHEAVKARGGSVAAEHGVGLMKRDELPHYKDAVALDLMRMIKRALDPENLLNPGKVIALEGADQPGFSPGL